MKTNKLLAAATLATGFDETVIIPSLPNRAEWDRYEAARRAKISSAIAAPHCDVHQHGRLSA